MTEVSPEIEAITEACEALKLRFSQERDGYYVTFCIQPNEMPTGLATSPLGSRWMLAFVQIGADEKPIPKPVSADKKRKLQNANVMRSAIMCGDPGFQKFLSQKYRKQWRGALGQGQEQAADTLRAILGIGSRKEIGTDPEALAAWDRIDAEYAMWKRGE